MSTYVYKSFGHGSQIMNCPNLFNFIHTGEMTFLISVLFYSCPPCGRVVRNLQNSDSQNSTDSQQASLANVLKFVIFFYLKIKLQHPEN